MTRSFLGPRKNFVPYLTPSSTFIPYMTLCYIFHPATVNCAVKRRFCPCGPTTLLPPLNHVTSTRLALHHGPFLTIVDGSLASRSRGRGHVLHPAAAPSSHHAASAEAPRSRPSPAAGPSSCLARKRTGRGVPEEGEKDVLRARRGLDGGRGAPSPQLHRLLGTNAAEGPQRLRPPRRRQVRSPSASSSPVTGVLPFGLLLAGGRCSPLRLQLAAGLGRTRRPGGGEEGEGWWGPQGQNRLFTAQLTMAEWKMQRSVM